MRIIGRTRASSGKKMWGRHTWRANLKLSPQRAEQGAGAELLVRGEAPLKLKKPLSFLIPNGSGKFVSFSAFCKLESQAPNVTNPLLLPGATRHAGGSRGPDPPAAARTTCEIRIDPVRLRWCV